MCGPFSRGGSRLLSGAGFVSFTRAGANDFEVVEHPGEGRRGGALGGDFVTLALPSAPFRRLLAHAFLLLGWASFASFVYLAIDGDYTGGAFMFVQAWCMWGYAYQEGLRA